MARFFATNGVDEASAPAAEIEAALALGRLDGALGACPPATLRLFAAMQLRGTLIAALRQEGHAFTPSRFQAWFAGLATLSDEPSRLTRPPRALCDVILTELTHSSWEPLADLACRFRPALLAHNDYNAEDAHVDAQAAIADARSLIDALEHDARPLPFLALAKLHDAVAKDTRFAPAERSSEPLTLSGHRYMVERARLPSPRWAIELLWGEHWQAAGLLRYALPFPGLIRLDVSGDDIAPTDVRIALATTLRDAAQELSRQLAEADHHARRAADRRPGSRTTSRAPALFELLAGFGPLRASQVEILLGATRLGVRSILAALDAMGALDVRTIAGARLYGVVPGVPSVSDRSEPTAELAFSSAAIDDYNASMAHIEQLLVRSGAGIDDAED